MSKMGATPLYLVTILARAKTYSRASATLRVSGTVYTQYKYKYKGNLVN